MYYYILDPGNMSLPKFEQVQVELQGLLHEFNISGEFARITTLRTVSDLVDVAATRGAATLVVCGNDDTLNQVLAAVGQRDFLIGFIPLDAANSYLATILGLPNLITAVKTIAARRIITIDTATINQLYFISFVEFGVTSNNFSQVGPWATFRLLSKSPTTWTIKIDGSYTLSIQGLGGLVINSRSTSSKQEKIANPTDGFLDVLVMEEISKIDIFKYKELIAQGRLEELPNPTIIKCKTVELLEPRGAVVTMFGRPVAKFPAVITMTGKKQRMIVGKQRTF